MIAVAAERFDLALIAASTHPFARWREQSHTDSPRYESVADDLQGPGRRMIISGLHVHVGIECEADRIRVMNAVRPFLPILLALSTSSPFWQGEATGLKSYRTAINDATPRKGMPETFESWEDYRRTVAILVKSGVIDDATKIWWDLRPSDRYPTLEMRITDACPLIEDALCIAAIFRCLCRCLKRAHPSLLQSPLVLINENRWRAQRYGIEQGLLDIDDGHIASLAEIIDDMLAMIAADAAVLDCVDEVEHARTILHRGTSADRQRAQYAGLNDQGQNHTAALISLVDQLIEESATTRTVTGVVRGANDAVAAASAL